MRHEHLKALEEAAVGESQFMDHLDQYFDNTGRWSRELIKDGYILTPVPMLGYEHGWLAAPNVMWEYGRASDEAPLYLSNWRCDGCAAEQGAPDCGAAFKVCGRLLFADVLEREQADDDS